MVPDALDSVRQDLAALRARLARGEIDESTYHRQRELILADLSPEERALLGTASPAPQPATPQPATPRPITGSALGPSGSSGRGLRTSVPTLADLELGPGTVLLGQWRLERELGRGGFGAVFEAEELHLHEKQAVKVLDPGMVAREDLIARFRREVSLMRKLVHPRIVRVYDYREDLPQLVALISMELVTGGSVKQLLTAARAKNVEIPIPLALDILRQTLEALAEAHSDGVIHRDVTPGNVLLAGGSPEDLLSNSSLDPKVKLVDFGIAGLVERSELSQKSRVLGTAAYVAPEVLDPSVEVTPAADVYGAGAMGYELLTGKLPLGRFAEPGQLRKGLPSELNAFVLDLLQARPSERPKAGVAAGDLQTLAGKAQQEAARRKRIAGFERDLDSAVERGAEPEVVALSGELERLLAPGEQSEALERARRWQRVREAERRELEEARVREAAALERERQEAEQQRQAAERQRLEAWARQQDAACEEAERQRLEAERERQRQATIRRVEAEAAAHTQPGRARKKTLSPALLGVIAAAVVALVVAIGWGISSQRAAQERARVEAARLEQEKQAAVEAEKRRAAEAAEAERQRQARVLEEERQKAAKSERERIAREQEQARAAEVARLEQERKAAEAAAQRQREAEAAAQRQREAEAKARSQPSGTWRDERTGLLWTARDNGSDITWDKAKSYCENLRLGGFSDWRMPSIGELEEVYDGRQSQSQRGGAITLSSWWVWSGDLKEGDSSAAWNFKFSVGERNWFHRAYAFGTRALCVRRSGG